MVNISNGMIDNWMQQCIKKHSNKKRDDGLPNGALYAMLNETKNKSSNYTSKNVLDDISGMLMAGLETVSRNIICCCNILSHPKYTELQDRIYNEMNEMNENDCDVAKLTYLRAFVYEVLRCSSYNVPLVGIIRTIIDDNVKILNYNIPKGSLIVPNYGAFLREKLLEKSIYI